MADPKQNDGAEAFSAIEEEFFRAGDALDAAATSDASSAFEAAPVRTSVWSRLFKRTSRSVAKQPVVARASEPAADDEWDWQIAIARARHSTSS